MSNQADLKLLMEFIEANKHMMQSYALVILSDGGEVRMNVQSNVIGLSFMTKSLDNACSTMINHNIRKELRPE